MHIDQLNLDTFKTEKKKVLIKDVRNSKKFLFDKNGFIFKKIKFDIEAQKIKLNLKINKGYKNN